jgi:hypothetical protein
MIHLPLRTVQEAADYLDRNPSAMLATSESSVDASEARSRIHSAGFRENTRSCRPGLWLDKVGICHSNLIDIDNEINQWVSEGLTRKREKLRTPNDDTAYGGLWNFCTIL